MTVDVPDHDVMAADMPARTCCAECMVFGDRVSVTDARSCALDGQLLQMKNT